VQELNKESKIERAKVLNKKLSLCQEVKEYVEKDTWKNIIQPLLDAMIEDVVGGKRGDIYRNGALCKPSGDYEYFTGYKQALMDFHNKVWNYVVSIKGIEEQIKFIEKDVLGEAKYKIPMLEDKNECARHGI